MNFKFTKWYIAFSWLPLVLFLLVLIYVKQFDGWGAWAAGGILIYPLMLSVLMGSLGIIMIVVSARKNSVATRLIVATLLSGCIALWCLGRAIIMEIQRIF